MPAEQSGISINSSARFLCQANSNSVRPAQSCYYEFCYSFVRDGHGHSGAFHKLKRPAAADFTFLRKDNSSMDVRSKLSQIKQRNDGGGGNEKVDGP